MFRSGKTCQFVAKYMFRAIQYYFCKPCYSFINRVFISIDNTSMWEYILIFFLLVPLKKHFQVKSRKMDKGSSGLLQS